MKYEKNSDHYRKPSLFAQLPTGKNIGNSLSIVSGEYILTDATIVERIPGGKISISEAFTLEDVEKLLK